MENFQSYYAEIIKNTVLMKYLSIALYVIVFIAAAKIATGAIKRAFERLIEKTDDPEAKKNFTTTRMVVTYVVNVVFSALLLLLILSKLGVDIRPLLATAGLLSVAIGFAAKSFVEDLANGLPILLEGQIRVGDVVEVKGIVGTVERINLKRTVLRSIDGTLHFIRNSMIDTISNRSYDYSVAMFDISVPYNADAAHVIELLKELGTQLAQNSSVSDLLVGPLEVLGLDKFEENAMVIKCIIKTVPTKQWAVKRAFNLMIKEKFDELGISLHHPQVMMNRENT
ncbi:small conductance mechanosensitive channel [Candidatus Gastranaerophilus sp. (ex Termes propinquus)]|nr:small conductance mechanosensitive channel [Candidatus Gastranaerophilus sp. (ex Termes propinquus)]